MGMKISVVTVCYNSESTVADTIRSFRDQTYPDKELIIVDGASTDNTLKVVQSLGHPQIRVFSEPDRGAFDGMNKGLRLFSGDAVGILNSDDTFHDSKALSRISDALQDSDIVYGDLDMVTDHASKIVVREWRSGVFKPRSFQYGWMPPHPTLYVRRDVIERVVGFDISYRTTADYDFALRAMVLNNFRIKYIPHVLVDFQLGGLSTGQWKTTFKASLDLLRSRRQHLVAPAVDLAFFLWPLRKIVQLRRLGPYIRRRNRGVSQNTLPAA
jgi:glycosyltransferase